jgi:DNA-binding transcriptional regulator YiaG
MPNIATVLKAEITRVARKQVRGETLNLKKASGQYRTDIAALKRRVVALERQVTRLGRLVNSKKALPAAADDKATALRFSAKGLITHRRRLGLTATAVAKLLGVSAQSVYKWEAGKARPRASQFAAIAALRAMTKTDAAARLSGSKGSKG